MDWRGLGDGRGRGLFSAWAIGLCGAVSACSGDGDAGPATGVGGVAGGAVGAGAVSGRDASGGDGAGASSVHGDAGAGAGAGTDAAGAHQGGSAGSAGTAEATAGTGGDNEMQLSSEKVAAACSTPMTSAFALDPAFGWQVAKLRIDPSVPSCTLDATPDSEGGLGPTLIFAVESNGARSVWSSSPWDYGVDSAQGSNDLQLTQSLTVFPFLGTVKLRVEFSFGADALTIKAVTAE
jgi:hypothetical protein